MPHASCLVSSEIFVPLEPGWAFVNSEPWEPDYLAKWSRKGADRG